MSHELSIIDGVAEMASTEAEWHGLENRLARGASIEDWTNTAGMAWKIQRGFVRFATGRDQDFTQWGKMDDKVVLFRGDNGEPLGVVSDNYKIVQPKEVLEFFRDLTDSAGFTLETAGVLFGGKKFWALASIGAESFVADKRDAMKRYLMLSTSADGSVATEGRYTDVRVVCNNTISAAFRKDAPKVKVSHRSRFDATMAKQDLGVDKAHHDFAAAMQDFRKLADVRISSEQLIKQTLEVVKPGASLLTGKDLDKVLRSKPVQRIGELAYGRAIGAEYDGTDGTQYGWLNAVTQYVDHEARARNPENRVNSAWFGKGDNVKQAAFEMAMQAADGSVTYVPGWKEVDTSSDATDDFSALLARPVLPGGK